MDLLMKNTSIRGLQRVNSLPSYALTNAGITYRFSLGNSNKMTFRANMFNVFDKVAIQQHG